MIKYIIHYLLSLADCNYQQAYWIAVKESRFSVMNVAMIVLQESDKQNQQGIF